MDSDIITLLLLWFAWCIIHSGMISLTVTKYLERRLSNNFRYYRLIYNLMAVTTLLPVILYSQSIHSRVIFQWDGSLFWIRAILLTCSILLFHLGSKHYSFRQFLGFRQINSGNSHKSLTKSGALNTSGILNVTRHPWYLATLLIIWSLRQELDTVAILSNSILTCYVIVGTILEEIKLVAEYGEEYNTYKKNVSMLIPIKYLKSRI